MYKFSKNQPFLKIFFGVASFEKIQKTMILAFHCTFFADFNPVYISKCVGGEKEYLLLNIEYT